MAQFFVGNNGKDFKPCPAGVHLAWCYGLIDLGTQHDPKFNKHQRKVVLLFEVPGELDEEGKPVSVRAKVTASTGDRSNLRKWLENWRGKPFTPEQIQKFELSAVVGKGCNLVVVNKPRTDQPGKMSDFVDNILPFPKGATLAPCSRPNIIFSIDDWDDAVYKSLGQKMQEQIAASPEGKAKLSGQPAPTAAPAAAQDDSSIPF